MNLGPLAPHYQCTLYVHKIPLAQTISFIAQDWWVKDGLVYFNLPGSEQSHIFNLQFVIWMDIQHLKTGVES